MAIATESALQSIEVLCSNSAEPFSVLPVGLNAAICQFLFESCNNVPYLRPLGSHTAPHAALSACTTNTGTITAMTRLILTAMPAISAILFEYGVQ